MDIATTINAKVSVTFSVHYIDLLNESHLHGGNATESHFSLTLVTDDFKDISRVKRHQSIYKCLQDELDGPVHALALHLYTLSEWQDKGATSPSSPQCASKSA